jgi:hypothetical protein
MSEIITLALPRDLDEGTNLPPVIPFAKGDNRGSRFGKFSDSLLYDER